MLASIVSEIDNGHVACDEMVQLGAGDADGV
jgi:hypothetical protein